MTCDSCGTQNDATRKFCIECGLRLAVACPACGSPTPAGGKFCGECGSTLAAATPATGAAGPATAGTPTPAGMPTPAATTDTDADAPVAERRLVSVLFADLVGFTTISEHRDAEDVRDLLDGYFARCREIIGRYGGTIEKFIGDAVMAVWGTPVAQEDDAERAVRAALDLVEEVRRMGTTAEAPDLALRAGVLTGEAAVTLGASDMGMVAGDLVNTASRLQSVAAPGTVLVGESTRRATAEAIAFEEAGAHALKGKYLPVPAWRALRVTAKRGGAGRSEQLEAPFVGRDAELQLIKDFYHGTARERGVRLVSVIGQGGIGKSRLAWEFLKYIDGLTEVAYWHQGRSPAYGEGITFWALGEMVRMRIGIGEGTDAETTRERLAATLDEFVPDDEERRIVHRPLLQLLGVEDGAAGAERGELFAAWRTFFERIAEVGPVILVFEDLQWADEGLIDFIEDLLAWSRGHAIYVITLARPELLDRRPTWGAGQRGFTSLGLEPLTKAEMRELLDGLVPGLPAAAATRIVDRAEGIPLYAVETVRMLINDGRIEQTDGAYRPSGDLTALAVPESLHALIAARLDGLDPGERTLIQDASVLGLSFQADALAAVSGADPGEIEQRLRHLARRELVMLDDDPRSPERGQYRFVQGLIKEVAYGTLAKRDRRTRHLAAARHFEALGDDEMAGVLAQHYVEAYRAHPGGDEGAAVATQARIALRAAAARARALGSPARAQTYAELAIEVTTDPAEELILRRDAAQAAVDAGRHDQAVPHLERAVELGRETGDVASRRRATAQLGMVLVEGRQEEGQRLLDAAMAEPDLTSEADGYVELALAMATMHMRRGHYPEAVTLADEALPDAEARGLTEIAIELLITRSTALSNLGRSTESISTLTGLISVAERRGLSAATVRATINIGYALEQDDPEAAYRITRASLDRVRRWGLRWGLRYPVGNACDGAIGIGDWDWALEQVRDPMWEGGGPSERLWFGAVEATIGANRGEDVTAQTDELRQIAEAYDDAQYVGLSMGTRNAALQADGEHTEALRLARAAPLDSQGALDKAPPEGYRAALRLGDADAIREMLEVFHRARKGRRTDADRAAMRGGLAALEGHRGEAHGGYVEALRLFRELKLDWPWALTGVEAIVAGALDGAERQRVADEVRSILERLGARPYLAELEAALAAPANVPQRTAATHERATVDRVRTG